MATMLDQVAVSATGFISTLLIGRYAGPSELGLFSLSLSVSLIATSAQDALASSPLTVLGIDFGEQRKRVLTGSVAIHSVAIAIVIASVCALVSGVMFLIGGASWNWHLGCLLAVLIPTAMLRQFSRKLSFIRNEAWQASVTDVLVLVIQSGLMWWLLKRSELNSSSAILIVSLSCFIGGLIGIIWSRRAFAFERSVLRADFESAWRLGKWLLLSRWLTVIHANCVLWWLGWMMGSNAVGVFAACVSVVAVSNLLTFSMANFLEPYFARVQANEGSDALHREVRRVNRAMFLSMFAFMALLALGGGFVMRILYPDKAFEQVTPVVIALAIAYFLDAIGVGVNQLLRVKQAMRANVFASCLGLICTFTIAPITIWFAGIVGGVIALALGYGFTNYLRFCFAFPNLRGKDSFYVEGAWR